MANIKISQLPAASVVTAGSDVLPMVHAGVTQKVTPDLLVQTVLSAPGPIGDDVAGSAAFTTLTASGEVTLNPADANVALSPTGSGAVNIQPNGGLLINPASVGSLNNVAIGGATPQPGTFTALTSTGVTTLNGTTIPASVTLVDTNSAQTLAQKTLAYPRIWDPDRSNYYRITPVGDLALDVYTFLPVLTGNDYFSFRNFAETLTNKTISGASNTLTNIGNAALTNSSITIGSSPVSLGGTLSSVSGLSINSSAIGDSAASTGAFTTLSASSTVSGTGFSTYLASPPAIGGTTPAAGNFTTLGATGDVTLGDAAGDTLTINAGTTNFAGTGQRITGDFSNATIANRLMFQTSTVNGDTNLGFIPNGTSTTSRVGIYNNSDVANSSVLNIVCSNSNAVINSAAIGTGTYLPMTFYTGGREAMRIGATAGSDLSSLGIGYTSLSGVGEYGLAVSGKVGIGTSSPSNLLTVNSTTTSVPSAMRLARGSASIDAPSSYAAGDYALFSLAQNNASPSSGVAGFVRYLDIVANGAAGSADSLIRFFTNTSANAALERLRIDSSGQCIWKPDGTTSAMTLDASGWLSVGATPSEQGKFSVMGAAANQSSALGAIDAATVTIRNNINTALNQKAKLFLSGTSDSKAVIAGYYENYNGPADTGSGLLFGTQYNAAGGVVERLRLDSSGQCIWKPNGTTSAMTLDASGNLLVGGTVSPSGAGNIVCESATGKVGYGTGAGGTVTQATSKSTAVTLNKPCGQITMNNAALDGGASVTFVFNNSTIGGSDSFLVQSNYGANAGAYATQVMYVNTGVAFIKVTNITGGSLSEPVALTFAVIRGATS